MVTDARSRLGISDEQLAEFCKRHHIMRLALFGSVLRDDFGPSSDIDVLVEFEPAHTPGLKFFSMEGELSSLVGAKIDLNTPGFLSDRFRDRIVREAEVLFDVSRRRNSDSPHTRPRERSSRHGAGQASS